MKLHVIYNKDGDIVAAARLDTAAPVRARPRADEQAGHRAVDVYVPAASSITTWQAYAKS